MSAALQAKLITQFGGVPLILTIKSLVQVEDAEERQDSLHLTQLGLESRLINSGMPDIQPPVAELWHSSLQAPACPQLVCLLQASNHLSLNQ
jgi:hypothetical protein